MGIQTNNIAADLDREFYGMVAKIASEPDAKEQFDRLMRAWKRAQIVPGEPSTDATLSALWEEWKASANGIEQHGGDSEMGKVCTARFLAAREAIVRTTATGPVGLAVKLRCALDGMVEDIWASQALYDGDDTTLIARADEMCEEGNLIVDAIGFLNRAAPSRAEWDQAMVALAEAMAYAKGPRDHLSVEESDARTRVWTDAEDRLLDMPAPDVAALGWKLEWLLHPQTGSSPQAFGGASILADVRRLAGESLMVGAPGWGEPHMGWLQAYQASRVELDALPGDVPDDEPLLGRVNRLEAMILREPAHSKDAVLAKLFTAARISADGAEPPADQMRALVAEAEAAFGFAARVVAS